MTSAALNIPARGNNTNGVDRILNMPRARVYRAAALTVATATPTAVTWDTLDYDTDGYWDALSPTRLTVRTSSLCLFTTSSGWGATAGGSRQQWILKNGVTTYGLVVTPDPTGLGAYISTSQPIVMNAGDYATVMVYQSSGGNMNWDTGANQFTATMLSTL